MNMEIGLNCFFGLSSTARNKRSPTLLDSSRVVCVFTWSSMAAKRPIVVEGNTPGKPETKRQSTSGTSRKSLFQGNNGSNKSSGTREWSEAETSALVQYICLFWDDAGLDKWPMQKDPEFWNACASAVNKTCNSSRTGLSKLDNSAVYFVWLY